MAATAEAGKKEKFHKDVWRVMGWEQRELCQEVERDQSGAGDAGARGYPWLGKTDH